MASQDKSYFEISAGQTTLFHTKVTVLLCFSANSQRGAALKKKAAYFIKNNKA